MSIKGSSISWLNAALDRGDAITAWAVATEFPRGRLPLDYALAILLLITDQADRYERGVQRWLARWTVERGTDADAFRRALDLAPDLEGVTRLADLCERHELPQSEQALDRLYPPVR